MTGKRVVIYRHGRDLKPLGPGLARCPLCKRGVRLTELGHLRWHNTKRCGGTRCPGEGMKP